MVILNFLAAPRAVHTGRVCDLGEQENWGEAFQKTDTYANLALSEIFCTHWVIPTHDENQRHNQMQFCMPQKKGEFRAVQKVKKY